MYEIKYKNGEWWIAKNGNIIDMLGGFSDPVSPKVIIEMIKDEERK